MQQFNTDFNKQARTIQEIFYMRYLRVLGNLCLRSSSVPVSLAGGRIAGQMNGTYGWGEYRCRHMLAAIMNYCFTLMGPVMASGQLVSILP